MKNFKARLAGILACLLLFIVPLQADAGWNASPLPAASINTVFGDSTYLNPEWMTKKVTITWNGNTWMTGMDAFKDMPVRLTNNNGAIDCTFLNTAVFQSFFSAINASIASMTTTAAVPVFDNGAGSYIRISGTQHMEAVSSMPDWLAQMLHNLILTGQCTDIALELNDSLMTAISYLERIFETIDEPVAVKDAPGAVEMPPIIGKVTFDHVSFSYEEGIKTLDDVSFTAMPGESFAIVGPTGAGKTTIVNLLSRFYNIGSGTVYIDDTDISKVTLHSLRTQMGVMMQDSFIFSGTIMDNIRYGNRTATDDEVILAAKTVCAHDFIMQMEDGYYTQVNERGSRLSAGQRQLISFARALLADPKILILDEATSSIDTETEIILQKGLNELLKGRTSFIIAHRLSTIQNCTRILYVDKGKIQESGSHEELLLNKGPYYNLFMSQYSFMKDKAVQ